MQAANAILTLKDICYGSSQTAFERPMDAGNNHQQDIMRHNCLLLQDVGTLLQQIDKGLKSTPIFSKVEGPKDYKS